MAGTSFAFDVFLSHNSQDKPAVEQLARLLRDGYQVRAWLDKWNLVPGDSWQQALENALDNCQTFAVFVGPSGLGPWENPEMQLALDVRVRDPKRRVIPVLLPGAPDNQSLKLPPFLRLLTWVDFRNGLDDRQGLHLLYCGIKGIAPGDATEISASRGRVAERRIPPIVKKRLPYLADCGEQEYQLQNMVDNEKTWQSPIVVLVHGDELQGLDMFRTRLEEVSLPRLMQLDEDQVIKSYSVNWPAGIHDVNQFSKRWLNSLSNAVLRTGIGTKDVIQQELAGHPVPVLVHAMIHSSDWKPFGAAWIEQYLAFWRDWPQLAPRQKLLAFLFIKYESKFSKGGLFSKSINSQIEAQLREVNSENYAPLRCVVLPRLNGVSRAEAEEWARSDEVRAVCDSELVIREIREWYEKESNADGQKKVPMEKLVDSLKKLLDAYNVSQEAA